MSDRARNPRWRPRKSARWNCYLKTGLSLSSAGRWISATPRKRPLRGPYPSGADSTARRQIFHPPFGFIVLGVLATFAFALPLAITAHGRDASAAFFFTIWVLFCGLIIGMMIELSLASAWKAVVQTGVGWTKLLPATAAVAVFGGAIALLLKNLASGVSPFFFADAGAFLLINLGGDPAKTEIAARAASVGIKSLIPPVSRKVEQDKLNRLNPAADAPQDLDHFFPTPLRSK